MDRLETVAHLALAEAGVRVVDGQAAAEQARAVKTRDELAACAPTPRPATGRSDGCWR